MFDRYSSEVPYYSAAKTAPKRLPESAAEDRLRQVLTDDNCQIVSDAVDRWNVPLREEVRSITALKLKVGTNVSIDVVDGMPGPLAKAVSDFEPWQWWLVLNRPALEQADQGLKLVIENSEMLANYLPDTSKGVEAIGVSRAFISEILTRSVEKEILDRFRTINEDVLGAYWIYPSKIQIYWMPLAIFAPLLRVPLVTLTVAVLCHELVHAYTHRGADLNRQSWPTDLFIATDTYVKEGLAQYYTEKIMKELGGRLPDALAVFLAKTARQASPYTTKIGWATRGNRARRRRVGPCGSFATRSHRCSGTTNSSNYLGPPSRALGVRLGVNTACGEQKA
jgi:hypothetical protein